MKNSLWLFLFSLILTGYANGAEPSDEFSRANCLNNESITYNYWDPPEWRFVASHHYRDGTLRHYVTENPPAISTCIPGGLFGVKTVDGFWCRYYATYGTRHAGVHGAFLPSESHDDGNLFFTGDWSVTGYHAISYPGFGSVRTVTTASDCNLHFEQFY